LQRLTLCEIAALFCPARQTGKTTPESSFATVKATGRYQKDLAIGTGFFQRRKTTLGMMEGNPHVFLFHKNQKFVLLCQLDTVDNVKEDLILVIEHF
jgi:hypothetical protein